MAVTLFAESIVTVQDGEEPAHAPPQAVNPAPEAGAAVSVTSEFAGSFAVQLVPPADVQVIPPPATVPLPVTVTVSGKVVADGVNDAFTLWSELIETVQLLAKPEQAPPHPPNAKPESGISSSVTVEPVVTSQVQLVSDGLQSMFPPWTLPPLLAESPVTSTESVFVPGAGVVVKVAMASSSLPLNVSVHVEVPKQSPLQPVVKSQPEWGVAVRVTLPLVAVVV